MRHLFFLTTILLLFQNEQYAQSSSICDGLPEPEVNAGLDRCACTGESVTLTAQGNAECYTWTLDSEVLSTSATATIEAEGTNEYTVCGLGPNLCWKKCDVITLSASEFDSFLIVDGKCCYEDGDAFVSGDFGVQYAQGETDCIGQFSSLEFIPVQAAIEESCFGQGATLVSAFKTCGMDTIWSNAISVGVIKPDQPIISSELTANISKNNPGLDLSIEGGDDCAISPTFQIDILALINEIRGVVDKGSDGLNWGIQVTAQHEVSLACCPDEISECLKASKQLNTFGLSLTAFGGYNKEFKIGKYVKAILDGSINIGIEGSNDPNCISQGACFGSLISGQGMVAFETNNDAIEESFESIQSIWGGDADTFEDFLEKYVDVTVAGSVECLGSDSKVCYQEDRGVYFDITEPCCKVEGEATILLFNKVNLGGKFSFGNGNCQL